MEIRCMYCTVLLGNKEGQGISHTVCSKCIPIHLTDLFTSEEIKEMIVKQKAEEAKLKKS